MPKGFKGFKKENKIRLGTHHSGSTKKKMSKTRMKRKRKLGFLNSPATRIKMRTTAILQNRISGKKNPNWNGGITKLIHQIRSTYEYRQWRSDVFTRDNYSCQKCIHRDIKLNAHHVKSLSTILIEYGIKTLEEALNCTEIWNINNGITYCENCHTDTDSYLINLNRDIKGQYCKATKEFH